MKIIITGIECSGKTTLAHQLHQAIGGILVPEFSRSYLNNSGSTYHQNDILNIAKGQLALEREAETNGIRPIICDTSLIVMKVWSMIRFDSCDPWIISQIESQTWDLFFLCDHQIPYEEDPLRENDINRQFHYDIYHNELKGLNRPVHILQGNPHQRLTMAIEILSHLLS